MSEAPVPADLKITGLKKRVGDFTLSADFTVTMGQRAALVGRSGIGKTTLLRVIAGLETPDSGRIFLGNDDITGLPSQKRGIGFVFQDQALFPAMNVLDNVTFGLRMKGVSKSERDAKGLEWLGKVGLKGQANAPVTQLSGGEKQRIALVRALIWKPRLMLLDEPFSALDRDLRQTLCRELVDLHRLWSIPMILVSHNEADIESLTTLKLAFKESVSSADSSEILRSVSN